MKNTLKELNDKKSQAASLNSLLKRYDTFLFDIERASKSANFEIPDVQVYRKEKKGVEETIKHTTIDILIMTQEWDVVDSYINIYELEPKDILRKMEVAFDESTLITYNTKKGLKDLERRISEIQKDINDYNGYLNKRDPDDIGLGIDPDRERWNEAKRVAELNLTDKSKLYARAIADWKLVHSKVYDRNLTAADQLKTIQDIIKDKQNTLKLDK